VLRLFLAYKLEFLIADLLVTVKVSNLKQKVDIPKIFSQTIFYYWVWQLKFLQRKRFFVFAPFEIFGAQT